MTSQDTFHILSVQIVSHSVQTPSSFLVSPIYPVVSSKQVVYE